MLNFLTITTILICNYFNFICYWNNAFDTVWTNSNSTILAKRYVGL